MNEPRQLKDVTPLVVSVYRITNDHQEQAIGRSFLHTLLPPDQVDRARAYLEGCGRYYHCERGEPVMLFTLPHTPRQKVELFVETLGEMLASAGIPVSAAQTTTGSAKLRVTFADQAINLVITAERSSR